MTKTELLNQWFIELVYPGKVEDFVQEIGVPEPANNEIEKRFHIYTDNHRYYIVAIDHPGFDGYLGCQVSARKPRAGEDWTRGNDLPDGDFSKETWDKIVQAMLRYELVKLSKYQQPDQIPETEQK